MQPINSHTLANPMQSLETVSEEGSVPSIPNLVPDSETKLMVERTVTVHTQEVHKKRNKKKKKKMTEAQQVMILQKLGTPFSLSELKHSTSTETCSLFIDPCCPKLLSPEEKILLEYLLDQPPIYENSNLFEVFIDDFMVQWEMVIACAGSYNQEAMTVLANFKKNRSIEFEIYNLYRCIYEKEKKELIGFECEVNKITSALTLQIPRIIQWLNEYTIELSLTIITLEDLHLKNKSGAKLKTIYDLYERNFKPLHTTLKIFNKRVQLFSKCLQGKEMVTFLVNKKVSCWSEFYSSMVTGTINLNHQVSESFTKKISLLYGKDIKKLDHDIKHATLDDDVKHAVENFITQHKNLSFIVLSEIERLIRAQNDPIYAAVQFWKEENLNVPDALPREKCIDSLLYNILDMNMLDKWINDISRSSEFSTCCEVHVKTPHTHIRRLLMMLDLIDTVENPDLEEALTDPFLKTVQGHIKQWTEQSKEQVQNILDSVTLAQAATNLRRKFSAPSYRLSLCLLTLVPIFKLIYQQNFSCSQLDRIRQKLLHMIRTAKQNHQLDHLQPSELKTEIQEILFKQTFRLCVYMMIISDIKELFSKSPSDDVLHLLPNDVVPLLDLTGFDEIFKSSPVAAVEESSVEASLVILQEDMLPQPSTEECVVTHLSTHAAVIPPTAIPPKKPQVSLSKPPSMSEIPERQDFQEAVKRRVIVRMLERMGFVYERTGRHDIYHHCETSGQVVVPHSVEALGTRLSIFNQATRAFKEFEAKGKED